MIKDFMKRFALALVLLIGMISYTGFGNTTTDPAKNSETVMASMAAPVSVAIEVPSMVPNFEAFEIVASKIDSFAIKKQEPILSQAKVKVTENPYYEDGGGGELDCVNDNNSYQNFKDEIMSKTRAKFRCNSVTITESGSSVEMTPVIGGSTENESFFSYTPSGQINLGILNPHVKFEPGKEYYVDFSEA